jgi:DNA-binding MarR family transcriptional regulator
MKESVGRFFAVLEMIRKEMGGDYAPQQLSILLLCFLRSGITHGEIGEMLSMTQASVSRNVTRLSAKTVQDERGNPKQKGFGLAENRQDEMIDTRRSAVFLTKKGEQFLAKIQRALKGV